VSCRCHCISSFSQVARYVAYLPMCSLPTRQARLIRTCTHHRRRRLASGKLDLTLPSPPSAFAKATADEGEGESSAVFLVCFGEIRSSRPPFSASRRKPSRPSVPHRMMLAESSHDWPARRRPGRPGRSRSQIHLNRSGGEEGPGEPNRISAEKMNKLCGIPIKAW
jgi:hypothetical protein